MKQAEEDKRGTLGLGTLVALVIANMIGAGLFTSSGYSIAMLGNPDRVMFAWCICGVWAICGAIAYGALAARLPLSGGEYLFLSRLVHPSVGFIAGWISLIAGFTAPIAVAAKAAAEYGLPAIENPLVQNLAASALILIVAATLWAGVRCGARAQNMIVLLKLALLILFAAWTFSFAPADVWQGSVLRDREPSMLPSNLDGWFVLVASMSWIALSYTGFNAAVYVAGSATNARRNVPKAMILATLLVTIFYLALNYIFVYAPQAEMIAGEKDVAAIAAAAIGGDRLENLMRTIVTFAMISSVFAMLLAGPRVYQRMADDGVMPSIFRDTGSSPKAALFFQAALSIIAVFAGSLLALMEYLGVTLSACGALTTLALLWAKSKMPELKRLAPWELAATIVYLLITAGIIAATYSERTNNFYAMLVTFFAGLVVYLAARLYAGQKNASQTSK